MKFFTSSTRIALRCTLLSAASLLFACSGGGGQSAPGSDRVASQSVPAPQVRADMDTFRSLRGQLLPYLVSNESASEALGAVGLDGPEPQAVIFQGSEQELYFRVSYSGTANDDGSLSDYRRESIVFAGSSTQQILRATMSDTMASRGPFRITSESGKILRTSGIGVVSSHADPETSIVLMRDAALFPDGPARLLARLGDSVAEPAVPLPQGRTLAGALYRDGIIQDALVATPNDGLFAYDIQNLAERQLIAPRGRTEVWRSTRPVAGGIAYIGRDRALGGGTAELFRVQDGIAASVLSADGETSASLVIDQTAAFLLGRTTAYRVLHASPQGLPLAIYPDGRELDSVSGSSDRMIFLLLRHPQERFGSSYSLDKSTGVLTQLSEQGMRYIHAAYQTHYFYDCTGDQECVFTIQTSDGAQQHQIEGAVRHVGSSVRDTLPAAGWFERQYFYGNGALYVHDADTAPDAVTVIPLDFEADRIRIRGSGPNVLLGVDRTGDTQSDLYLYRHGATELEQITDTPHLSEQPL